MNVSEVGDVITEIGHWALENRTQPYARHANIFEVRQSHFDALQITHTIAVAIYSFQNRMNSIIPNDEKMNFIDYQTLI